MGKHFDNPSDQIKGFESLDEAVFQTMGSVSTCWESIEKAGVFDSSRAGDRCQELVDWIREQYGELLMEAWGVLANAQGWDEDSEWRQAAIQYRDRWHLVLPDLTNREQEQGEPT